MCFSKFFRRFKAPAPEPEGIPMPPAEELALIMRGKGLSFTDEIVKVLESPDLFRRIVILKRADGSYRAVCEELFPFDEDELKYFSPGDPPGFWCGTGGGVSLYDSLETALKEIRSDPQFKGFLEG